MATPVLIEPAALQVPAAGGTSAHQLTNSNAEVRFIFIFFISNSKSFPVQIQVRYAFKIKSTNNDHYRVNPVYGIVEPGAAAQVEVTRLVGFNLF